MRFLGIVALNCGGVEKCISLGRLSKFMHGVLSRGPSNQLSSRTSGHKRCRVDKEYCRVENASHERDFVHLRTLL